MKEQRSDVGGAGVWMTRLLYAVAAICAAGGAILLLAGVLENAYGSGGSGMPTIGIGLVMILSAVVALAPIPSAPAPRGRNPLPSEAEAENRRA